MDRALREPQILSQTDDLIALFKPPALHSVSSKSSHASASLEQFVAELKISESGLIDSGLLQRLDFHTTGLVLAAKNHAAYAQYQELLHQKECKKRYTFLTHYGFPKEPQHIACYLGGKYRGSAKVSSSRSPRKRYVLRETEFKLLMEDQDLGIALVQAELSRGFRHQIRVHSSLLGFPLIGDTMYGSSQSLGSVACFHDYPGEFYLFAKEIVYNDPATSKEVSWQSPDPTPRTLNELLNKAHDSQK